MKCSLPSRRGEGKEGSSVYKYNITSLRNAKHIDSTMWSFQFTELVCIGECMKYESARELQSIKLY